MTKKKFRKANKMTTNRKRRDKIEKRGEESQRGCPHGVKEASVLEGSCRKRGDVGGGGGES